VDPGLAGSHDRRTPDMKSIRGSCLCGQVAFEIASRPRRMMNCHCARCRRAHSAAHASNIFVSLREFRWLNGESQVLNYGPREDWHLGTAFCRSCGSTLPRVVNGVGVAVVPAGCLDSDPEIRVAVHGFAQAKASWFQITDNLAQFAGMPPVA
jgi:hypothetical protein